MTIYEFLILAGQVVGALTTIAGGIWGLYRYFYKPVIRGKMIKPFMDRLEKIDMICDNLKPNGGKSIYDALHRIEKRMIITEARGRSLVESLDIGEFIADTEGRFVSINSIACRKLGYTIESFAGSNWLNIIHPDDREYVYENWQQTIKEKKDFVLSYRLIDSESQPVKVDVVATYLENNHDIVGWIGVMHFK